MLQLVAKVPELPSSLLLSTNFHLLLLLLLFFPSFLVRKIGGPWTRVMFCIRPLLHLQPGTNWAQQAHWCFHTSCLWSVKGPQVLPTLWWSTWQQVEGMVPLSREQSFRGSYWCLFHGAEAGGIPACVGVSYTVSLQSSYSVFTPWTSRK